MDIDTIEVCWTVLQRYIKSSDEPSAASHLVAELLDNGLRDEDYKKLAEIDSSLSAAIQEYQHEDDDYWLDEDQ